MFYSLNIEAELHHQGKTIDNNNNILSYLFYYYVKKLQQQQHSLFSQTSVKSLRARPF